MNNLKDNFLDKIKDLKEQSFEGWSEDAVNGYLTALETVAEFYKDKEHYSEEDLRIMFKHGE